MVFEPTPTAITKLDTYAQYMREIGAIPSYQLDKCFACGLPSVWLYLKAIGLEGTYFDILNKLKNRHLLFKELFYLLLLTNGGNKFFPHVPQDFLKLEIPAEVKAAQLEVSDPEFEMAYAFTKEQLKATLELLVKPGKMIRIGDKSKAIGLMYHDNAYHIYHVDNAHALQFKSLDGCIDLIMRGLNDAGSAEEKTPLLIQVTSTGLAAEQGLKIKSANLLAQLLREVPRLTGEEAQSVLKIIVDGNLPVEHAAQMIAAGADVNHTYPGMENLLHLAWKHVKEDSKNGKALFNLLLETAALDSHAKAFYADVDPQFVAYYNKTASQQQPSKPQTKPFV